MSEVPDQEVIDAIESGSAITTRRVEFYESDGTTPWVPNKQTARMINGSVSVDSSRDERRTLDIVLDNGDNSLRPNPIDGLWYDKIIKVFRGIKYYSTTSQKSWEVQLGEFLIDKIEEESYPHHTKIAGRDYTKKCLTSKTEKSMSFASGTKIVDLIKAIASLAGITKFRLPVNTIETLNSLLAVERGTERWNLMKDIASSHDYDIYFDNQGYLTMRKFLDPSISPLMWTFQSGSKGNLVKWSRVTHDSRLYNHVIITGESGAEDVLPFFGEAMNTEPSSPTRIDRIGDRAYFYTSSFFTSNQQCIDLANSWLKTKALESFEASLESFTYPWMEAGEIIGFLDPKRIASEPTRYLLDQLTIPLGLGTMSITAKRVTYVNDANSAVSSDIDQEEVA